MTQHDFPLGHVARMGDLLLVVDLIPSASPNQCSRALQYAAENGHADCVKALIPYSDPTAHNHWALFMAAAKGNLECVRLLAPFASAEEISTPLGWAAGQGHLECVHNLSALTSDYHVAVRQAAENGRVECLQFLLSLIPSPNPSSLSGDWALVDACTHGHTECVKLLLARRPPRSENIPGLLEAAHGGHVECVKLLIPLLSPDVDHTQALVNAARGHLECVKLLIPLCDPTAHKSEALFVAVVEGFVDCIEALFPVSNPTVVGKRLQAAKRIEVSEHGRNKFEQMLLKNATAHAAPQRAAARKL